MLFPVIVSPPIRAIHARHQRAIGRYFLFLVTIVLMIHFRTGGMMMNARAIQYPHVTIGICSYHAKGFANHTKICTRIISVASFHLLNKTSPLIRAANVGARNVSIPIDVAGLTYGTVHPKISPDTVPYRGPSNGAVRLESKTLENVIVTPVPGSG